MEHRNDNLTVRLLLPALLLVLCLAPLSGAETADTYSFEELDEIVGPIALYPDVVISSMLPASTVPTDVVQAARWVGEQEGEITEVPEDSGWDPAVEAMVQFPDVLTWMSENLDWMEMLGYAVAVQESDVLQAIQDFRAKAQDAGNLKSDDHIQVQQEAEVIYIEPAQPEVVYVPTYDPVAVVRPGYSWPSWGVGLAMGAVGAWAFHGIRYGGHGHHGSINVHNNRNYNFNNNGNINRGNIGGGNHWNSTNKPNRRPSTRPNQRPSTRQNRSGGARPGKGGVKPGSSRPGQRPGGQRPGSRPGGSRPGSKPGTKPGGTRPGSKPGAKPGGRPSTRPSTKPTSRPKSTKGSKSTMSGSSRNGRSTKKASSRGNRSMSSGSSRSRSSGASRSRSGGSRSSGSRGGSRGGGGRGGGGRRR